MPSPVLRDNLLRVITMMHFRRHLSEMGAVLSVGFVLSSTGEWRSIEEVSAAPADDAEFGVEAAIATISQ